MTSRLSAQFLSVEPLARWRRLASCAGETQTAGFTLIELLVVLAIIGMSLAIAVPLLARHLTGASLNAATSQIRTALRGARSTAITEDRPVVFRGDPGGGYWLDRHHFTLPVMGGGEPSRVAIEGGPHISFYPSGGSSGGRIVVVSGDAQRRLAVDTLTGRAR
jgi:general secretion pathway protein H